MRIELENHGPDEATLRRAADALVPQHLVVGRRRRRGRGSSATARRSSSPTIALAGYRLEAAPGPDGAPPEALFCENETNAPRVFGSERDDAVPEGRHQRPRRLGRGDRQPGRRRHEGGAPLPRDRAPPAARPSCGCGCTGRRRAEAGRRLGGRRRSTRSSPRARRTPTSSTPRSRRTARRRSRCGSSARRAPASSGASRSTRTTSRRWLDGDPGEPPPPEAHQHGRNSDWRHLDSFDVLAMPDPWEYPWFAAWDLGFHCDPVGAPRSRVREVPADRAAARVVPAPERRAPGVRVELRRRQPAGARDGGDARVRDRRRHATASSSSASSRSC